MTVAVAIMVVIVIIPITVMVPAVFVNVPPLPVFPPAAFPCFTYTVAPAVGLRAEESVVLDGFVELMICLFNPPPAAIIIVSRGAWCEGKQERCGQGRRSQRSATEEHTFRMFEYLHLHPPLPGIQIAIRIRKIVSGP
jgi:hypothetical protein